MKLLRRKIHRFSSRHLLGLLTILSVVCLEYFPKIENDLDPKSNSLICLFSNEITARSLNEIIAPGLSARLSD